jgi:hypothetical protein
MMRALAPAMFFFCALAFAAHAQRPDCPALNAPMPTSPPGPPPKFMPHFEFPQKFDPNFRPPPPSGVDFPPPDDIEKRKANDWLTEVEDGHVAALPRLAARVRRETPAGAARVQVDASKTPLAAWEFLGYAREGSPNRVSRLYRRADGSLLNLEEWDFAADGGAVYQSAGMRNARVGTHEATSTGLRGKSGCIESMLSWFDERKNVSLRIAGPLPLAEQRAVLREVAESVARVDKRDGSAAH